MKLTAQTSSSNIYNDLMTDAQREKVSNTWTEDRRLSFAVRNTDSTNTLYIEGADIQATTNGSFPIWPWQSFTDAISGSSLDSLNVIADTNNQDFILYVN